MQRAAEGQAAAAAARQLLAFLLLFMETLRIFSSFKCSLGAEQFSAAALASLTLHGYCTDTYCRYGYYTVPDCNREVIANIEIAMKDSIPRYIATARIFCNEGYYTIAYCNCTASASVYIAVMDNVNYTMIFF